MATLKSIPKAKVWYEHIKEGDKLLVQLHPKHLWYNFVGDDRIEVTVATKYRDGSLNGTFHHPSLKRGITRIDLGWQGVIWEDSYPATILRKIK